ncbi:hypothetical protein CYY_005635 [Polysphondylium violaceum]|uniref:Glycosyltransferase n=1 Tax=Polysphondylium violaceum TaxID=133409 RepID=A0A8J4V3Z0_9MYCE|nr:hypothetical protein CYY_005635 [Polysphondylium violaceum]
MTNNTFINLYIANKPPPPNGVSKIPDDDFFRGLEIEFTTHPFYINATITDHHQNIDDTKSSPIRNNNNNNNNDSNDSNNNNNNNNNKNKNNNSQYFVTVVTQSTVDRLYKVGLMASKWKAPISIALYIKNRDIELPLLTKILNENPSLKKYADIHLLYSNQTRYPVNNLRNLAIKYSRTDLVFVMDADFIPPYGFHDYIASFKNYLHINRSNYKQYQKVLANVDFVDRSTFTSINHTIQMVPEDEEVKVAFVVPSFSSSFEPNLLPDDKPTLLSMVSQKKVEPSNLKVCRKCHSPTNFPRWVDAKEPFEAVYSWIYEPYLIFDRTKTEWFDERLKGYGFDKNTHTLMMALQGFRFLVLPEAYIVHINHRESTWEGPKQHQQLWDSLRMVCEIIPEGKKRYNFDPLKRIIDEPLADECYSDAHW